MCTECGCGLPSDKPPQITSGHNSHADQRGSKHHHDHEHEHGPGHHHGEDHAHPQEHAHTHTHPVRPGAERRVIEARYSILEKNDRLAERNRGFFAAKDLLVLNVLSSPGSGKTTLLCETIRRLASSDIRAAVIVGDLATENDALHLRKTGAQVVQVSTGTVCHLEAAMVANAVSRLDLSVVQILIIENVGNLVCPAAYDLGETLRVVLLSVTEGEDKPLKYPPVFENSDVVVISKTDLVEPCGFNEKLALENVKRAAPRAQILSLSARTGVGMDAWLRLLQAKYTDRRQLTRG